MNVSVVIPTLNEEGLLPRAIESVQGEATEVLVVDGGSSDRSAAVAASAGARVLEAPRGRGPQLDRGAREAQGDWIVFLHADTRLEPGWCPSILDLDAEVVGGAFRFALDTARPSRRYAEWAVSLRCRVLGLPFGDQALFCRRRAYRDSGGFPHLPLFEDVAFVRRLRRLGPTALLPQRAVTSPRRWEASGPALTTLRNNALLLMFFAGVPATRLARLYGTRNGGGPGASDCGEGAPSSGATPTEGGSRGR